MDINASDKIELFMNNEPGDVDLTKRLEVRQNPLGPLVMLRRKFFNDEIPEEIDWVPAVVAMLLLMSDPDNGVKYKSGIIEWVYTYAGDWEGSA